MNTMDTINKETNVIKTIEFNKPEWKDIIEIRCEIDDNEGVTYTIKTIKDGNMVCKFIYTKQELNAGDYCLFSDIDKHIDENEKFWDEAEEEWKPVWDAVEIALNDFEQFLKENYGTAKISHES